MFKPGDRVRSLLDHNGWLGKVGVVQFIEQGFVSVVFEDQPSGYTVTTRWTETYLELVPVSTPEYDEFDQSED